MKKMLKFSVILLGLALILGLTGCRHGGESDEDYTVNPAFNGFYNYPAGRVNQGGRLTIRNTVASEALLFTGTVDKDNYIGTVSSLGSVIVKLPEEKFYTIIAVEKTNYLERRAQASQFNSLTYYSNIQPYTISVSSSSTYGGGNWVFNNNTTFWVQVKKSDLSQNYAVIAPSAQRVIVPIGIGEIYDYFLYFSKELKYNGKVIALVETTDRSQANTATVSDSSPTYTTTINNANMLNSNIKPAVMVINNTGKTVRVYYANSQKTNGAPGGDFVVANGTRQLVSGFDSGDNTNSISFSTFAWGGYKAVPINQPMSANKVYEITIPGSENAADITVTEVDASQYYN
ncbi:hypothetical protein ACYULU_01960 [Breznakiellaceae bacterium SP9]